MNCIGTRSARFGLDGLGKSSGLRYVVYSFDSLQLPSIYSFSKRFFFLFVANLLLLLMTVDYKIYEQAVEATHRFKEIFYDSNE